ncbi:hypothetical protein IQ07DRAFT_525288 [Pyrenochaeta sp. DS3sAY3a]|nr:hypothetical protein IQ07DRAFT_525288 [Pyrenochaeta sp. DS3sAY3a]
MEPLAGVASGMAVVSLSLQLIQSVDTIRTFIRNVRDATKELERLSSLLTRLAAILEDTRNLLELQSASENRIDGFSAPSSSVLICLQSCKISLQPLETLVQKMQKSPNASSLSQLRSDIKLGLKTKDITLLETRIQHEIGGLSTALGVNMNSLLYVQITFTKKYSHAKAEQCNCTSNSPPNEGSEQT